MNRTRKKQENRQAAENHFLPPFSCSLSETLWTISYQINRRDFWLDEYFTYFYHPWARWVMALLIGSMIYGFVHKLMLTHNLASATLVLLPTESHQWMWLLIIFLRLQRRMPTSNGVRNCSAVIDAQRLCCTEPEKVYKFPWKKVMAIRQTIDYVLFFTWNGGTFTVPKRAFDNPDDAQKFYETALFYKQATKSGQMVPVPQDETVWPPAPRSGA